MSGLPSGERHLPPKASAKPTEKLKAKGRNLLILTAIGFAVPRLGFKATIFLCPSPLSPPLHPHLLFKEVGYLEATTEDRRQFLPVQLGSPKKHQVLQALFIKQSLLS